MVIKTINAYGIQDLVSLSADTADIFLVNYQKTIIFATYYSIPEVIRISQYLSEVKNCIVMLCAKLIIEDDRYYSVVVFESGKLLGIADAISEEGYLQGKMQKIYRVKDNKIGVCVGSDFLQPGMDNQYLCGADIVIHICNEDFEKKHYRALKARSGFNSGQFISFYKDDVFVFDSYLKRINVGDNIYVKFSKESKRKLNGFLKVAIIE